MDWETLNFSNSTTELTNSLQCIIGKALNSQTQPTRELTHQKFPDRLLSEVLQTLAEVDQQSVVKPEQ